MKRAGWVALLGAVLLAVAYVFDAAVLFVPGVAFAAVGALTPLWIGVAARGTSVTRVLHADRVVEDQPVEATIKLRWGLFGSPGIELLDPLGREAMAFAPRISPLRSGRTTEARIVARFSRRGRRRFDPPCVAISDQLGIVRIVRRGSSGPEELLVLPRTERVRWPRPGEGERLHSAASNASIETLAATDVDGLRPYRPGTPASRISWPALARGAGLLERRLRTDRDGGPLVVLDVRCSGPAGDVDAAVRAAGSLTLELARRMGCDLLLPGDRRPIHLEADLVAWSAVHVRLALIEGGPDAPMPSLGARQRSGQIFYVAAEANRVPAVLARAEKHGVVLVVPSSADAPTRHFTGLEVSGCRGYLLGAPAGARPKERAA